MTSTVLARRYAKALFAVAKEGGKLEAFSKALEDVRAFFEESPDVESALINPVVPVDAKQSIMEEIIKASEADKEFANFLRLLAERRRIQHLREIVECFQELMDEELGVVRAVVTTAVALPDELKAKVSDVLAQATGKQVVLQMEEDPAIIGGMVAQIGDMVWDGSIKSQLQDLKQSIGRSDLG